MAVLGLIILLILAGNMVRLAQTLFSPKIASSKSYLWKGDFNLNLVVTGDQSISVLVFNPREKKLSIVKIPSQTLVTVPGGFGNWQIRSVYGLAGVDVLKQTVANFLGLPIDGFLEFEGELTKDFLTLSNLSSIKGDLTPWEFIMLKLSLFSVRFDKVNTIDLAQTLERAKLSDGEEVFTSDPPRVDSVISSLADPAFRQENKSIAIFNGTARAGLAQSVARMIANMGGNVIITANTAETKKTTVLGEDSKTLKRLKQILDKCKKDDKNCGKIDSKEGRAQINIILGQE